MPSTRTRLRDDDGYVLVTALILMVIMLGVGLTLVGSVDVGQERVREQRVRETALNLTEGVLYAQGFALASTWPGDDSSAMPPAMCTEASRIAGCPDPDFLAEGNSLNGLANFSNVDASLAGVEWETRVRDNGAPLAVYTTANADLPQSGTSLLTGQPYTCAAPCRWDANGDRQLWVQARATIQDKPRNVVALLRLETLREAAPTSAVLSGGLVATNNGTSHLFVDAAGSQIVVRCDPSASQCAEYRTEPTPQLSPAPSNPAGTPNSLLTTQQINRLREVAKSLGNHYPAGQCPTEAGLVGSVVFVENCAYRKYQTFTSGFPTCNPTQPAGMDPTCLNQSGTPGILIWQCGRMETAGSATFVGLIYMVNGSNGACPAIGSTPIKCQANSTVNDVFTTNGGFGVWGAVAVDGNGCMKFGSNGLQVQYDQNVFNALASYGAVGLVQNTWRELDPNE